MNILKIIVLMMPIFVDLWIIAIEGCKTYSFFKFNAFYNRLHRMQYHMQPQTISKIVHYFHMNERRSSEKKHKIIVVKK